MSKKVIIGVVAGIVIFVFGSIIISQNKYEKAIYAAEEAGAMNTVNTYSSMPDPKGYVKRLEIQEVEYDMNAELKLMKIEEMESMSSRFESVLEDCIDTSLNSLYPSQEAYAELEAIELEYYASKDALGENPSMEAIDAHIALIEELSVSLSEIDRYLETKGDMGFMDYYLSSSKYKTPETCKETAAILGVESIPGCETLEKDVLLGFEWRDGCFEISSEDVCTKILIESENYSYVWYTDTGKWWIYDSETWNVVDNGTEEFSSTIDQPTFQGYQDNWEEGSTDNYNGISETAELTGNPYGI